MRTTFTTMGTVASLRHDGELSPENFERMRAGFERTERLFSLYRHDSELSRVAEHGMSLTETSQEVRSAYAAALVWRDRTGGAFSPHRPDGVVDLSGLVKATAIAEAGVVLDDAVAAGELDSWCLGVGGDLLRSQQGDPARIGIVDPNDLSRLLTAIVLGPHRLAVATSGSAERGDHIWTRRVEERPEFVQATVAANDIVTADVLATAIVSGGRAALDAIVAREDIDVLAIDRSGEIRATPGFLAAVKAAKR